MILKVSILAVLHVCVEIVHATLTVLFRPAHHAPNDGHKLSAEAEPAVLDLSGEAFVPHMWLLPRCRGIVHHGGSGTTGAALRCLVTMGVGSLVDPYGKTLMFSR